MVGGLVAAENLTLAHPGAAATGPFLRPREAQAARRGVVREARRPAPRNPALDLGRFSGGNQQKVVHGASGSWTSG